MTMTSLSLYTGITLVAIGVIAYIATGAAHATALLPVVPGVLIGGAGLLAERNEAWRRHLMHGATAVALLTALGTLRGFALLPSVAGIAQVATALVCLAYVVMGVRSFVEARRASG